MRKPFYLISAIIGMILFSGFISSDNLGQRDGTQKENCDSQKHSIYGLPHAIKGKRLKLLMNEGYLAGYDSILMQSCWVSYELTRDELVKNATRDDKFRPDSRLTGRRAELKDYKKCGYDRGHLAPAADMAWSAQAMSESFLLSNMSPQLPGLNRGEWKRLEEWIRDLAQQFDTIAIVTGPLFNGAEKKTKDKGIPVPGAFFKVLLVKDEMKHYQAIGFILPNLEKTQDFLNYAVSVDSVEHSSGLDFFHCLPDKIERKVEATFSKNSWLNMEDQ